MSDSVDSLKKLADSGGGGGGAFAGFGAGMFGGGGVRAGANEGVVQKVRLVFGQLVDVVQLSFWMMCVGLGSICDFVLFGHRIELRRGGRHALRKVSWSSLSLFPNP